MPHTMPGGFSRSQADGNGKLKHTTPAPDGHGASEPNRNDETATNGQPRNKPRTRRANREEIDTMRQATAERIVLTFWWINYGGGTFRRYYTEAEAMRAWAVAWASYCAAGCKPPGRPYKQILK
jgi:hypothetical protein